MKLPGARDILLYYAAFVVVAAIVVFRRRVSKTMRLKMRGTHPKLPVIGPSARESSVGKNTFGVPSADTDKFSHINGGGERPLNVVFNYNGHSWDAYEVLGLPAGSTLEKVERSYLLALTSIDETSRPFLHAAYRAIQAEWKSFSKASS